MSNQLESPLISVGQEPMAGLEDQSFSLSRIAFEQYIDMRNEVKDIVKPEGETLTAIQESVREWLDSEPTFTEGQRYDHYDREHVDNKILGLTRLLRDKYADTIDERELTTTEAFLDSTFDLYNDRNQDGSVSEDADGSFAFVVPARMSRKDKDYGQEVEPVIPALRYVPNELRAQMMVGMPPFVIDTYKRDVDGKRGYLVFAPIFGDMLEDMPKQGAGISELMTTARYNIDNAVDFAQQRFGVTVVGLGATLPSLTNFGKAVKNKNVVITNGHGGTAHLIVTTAQEILNKTTLVHNAEAPLIGVLGCGAIGGPTASLISHEFDPPTAIYDTNSSRVERTAIAIEEQRKADLLARNEHDEDQAEVVIKSADEEALVKECDIIVSAITQRVYLRDFQTRPNLFGKVVIDDSQPGSFDPKEVAEHGGTLVWVIGRDTQGNIARDGYDYGTMVDEKFDLFGCEAEAAVLRRYEQDLIKMGVPEQTRARVMERYAVRQAVTPQKARQIGFLFTRYGIVPSQLQAFGNLVQEKPLEVVG